MTFKELTKQMSTPSGQFLCPPLDTAETLKPAVRKRERLRRGQVWYVAFGATIGCEIRKTRPAVVISADCYNRNARNRTVVVLPLKSLAPRRGMRYDQVVVRPPEGGLTKVSVTVSNQVRAVSIDRLVKRLGQLREGTMDVIGRKTAFALGLAKEVA